MRHSLHAGAPEKKLVASVCLFAVLLLWAPLLAGAWQAHGRACCNNGLCLAHGSLPSHPNAASGSGPDCEHRRTNQKQAGTVNCSMSCCRQSDDFVAASLTFVVPAQSTVFDACVTAVLRLSGPTDLVRPLAPPSPP